MKKASLLQHVQFAAFAATLVTGHNALAADGTWILDSDSNWSNSSGWLDGSIADGVGATANITADVSGGGFRTITVDSSRTLGILNIGDANNTTRYTLGVANGSALTMSNGVATAELNQVSTSAVNSINVPLQLASSLQINNASDSSLSFSSTSLISASSAGTKTITNSSSGAGTLALAGLISDGSGQVAFTQNSSTSTLISSANHSFTGNFTLAAGRVEVTGGTLTAGALGAGTKVLNGGTLVNGGTAVATVGGPVTLGGNVTLVGTTGGTSGSTRLVLGGLVTLTGNRSVTVSNEANASEGGYVTLQGGIAESGGSYSFTKLGQGILRIEGAATTSYTGGTFIREGTLRIGSANAGSRLLTTGDVEVDGGIFDVMTVSYNPQTIRNLNLVSGSVTGNEFALTVSSFNMSSGTVSKVIGGNTSSTFTKGTAGTVTLSGANTYTGVTTINDGILSVGTIGNGTGASNLGNAANVASNLVINGGTLQYTGNAATTDRLFTLGTSGGALDASGSGAITFSGAPTIGGNGTRTLTLTGSNTGDNALSGALANSANNSATGVAKTGAGTWRLSGNNTYSGGTTVSAGALVVGHNNGLGAAAGGVGILGGNAAVLKFNAGITVSNAVTFSNTNNSSSVQTVVSDNAAYRTGTLGSFSSAFAGGQEDTAASILAGTNTSGVDATLIMSFAGSAVATNDGIRISDVFNLSGTGDDTFVLQLNVTTVTAGSVLGWNNEGTWVNAVDGNTGPAGSLAGAYNTSWSEFLSQNGNSFDGTTMIGAYGVDAENGDVWAVVNHNSEFSVIPEPSTWALLAVSGGLLASFRRRSRKTA